LLVRFCQYLGAGTATVNVCFPSNAIQIEGELTDYISVADSGNRMHRSLLHVLRYTDVQ